MISAPGTIIRTSWKKSAPAPYPPQEAHGHPDQDPRQGQNTIGKLRDRCNHQTGAFGPEVGGAGRLVSRPSGHSAWREARAEVGGGCQKSMMERWSEKGAA